MNIYEQTPLSNNSWPFLGAFLITVGLAILGWSLYLVANFFGHGDESIILIKIINAGPLLLKSPAGVVEIPGALSKTTSIGMAIALLAIITGIGKSIFQAGIRLISPDQQGLIKALREMRNTGPHVSK